MIKCMKCDNVVDLTGKCQKCGKQILHIKGNASITIGDGDTEVKFGT